MTRDYLIVAAALGMLVVAFLILRIAKRNEREDAVIEEKPRKMWYQLGCTGCGTPTPHAQITDGLCPECYVPAETAAEVNIEITMPMLNAGIDALRAGPQRDARTAGDMFRAMLKAMPVEQKRELLRNPIFTVPKPELADPA